MNHPDPARRAPLRVYVFPGQSNPTEEFVKEHTDEHNQWRRVEILPVTSVDDFLTIWKNNKGASYADFMLAGFPTEVTEKVIKECGIEII